MSIKDTIIQITNNGMGKGPEELQLTLIDKYLQLLDQSGEYPAAICFYTDGVKLTTNGSPVLEQLRTLENKGVRLIVCSTCLNFFGLADQLALGIAGGMTDIIEAQLRAEKVITL